MMKRKVFCLSYMSISYMKTNISFRSYFETPKSSRKISDKFIRDLSDALGRVLDMDDDALGTR